MQHLREGVPAVCLIAGMLNDFSNVSKVILTCYRQVKNAERTIGTGGLNPGNTVLIRSVYLLGLFAQHARIGEHREQMNPQLGLPTNSSATGLIAKLLASFTKSVIPEALRKVAITSYGIVFEAQFNCRVLVSWEHGLL